MQNDFEPAFAALMGNEGGFVANPADPGGATKYGISERVARANGYTGDMRDLPVESARQIARAEYWNPIHGDQLPSELAFQVFDACYNSGEQRAIKWLQQACGATPDGFLGIYTLGAIKAQDVDKLVMRFDAQRLLFLDSLPTFPTFGRGWCNRIANNLLRAAG